MRIADLGECYFNWRKCLWETFPEHWVWFNDRASWIVIGFPLATTLERGVPDPLRERRESVCTVWWRDTTRTARTRRSTKIPRHRGEA
jgi:hypothetical protein